jgi:predicted MFS family arabinose efflux permease
MKHADNPARPEHGLTRDALRASGRADILLFLLVMTVASTCGLQAWRTLLNNFAVETAHLAADQIGIVQSLREVPGFLSMFVIYLLFLFTEQRAAALAVVVLGIGVGLTGFFPTLWGISLATLIWSMGFHAFGPLSQSLVLQHFTTLEAPVVLSRFRSLGALGNIAVGICIYFLADAMGYTEMFAVAGVLVVLAGLWGLWRNPRGNAVTPQKKKMYLRRRYWLYYLLTFLEGSRRQIFVVFAVYLLVKKFDFSVQSVTMLFVINNAINYFLNPMIGRAINRFGERQLLTVEYAGMIVVFLTYAYTDSYIVAGIMYVLDFVIFNFSIAVNTYYQKIAAPEDIASGMAMGFTINHIAAVVVPFLGGVLWMFDYRIPFFIGVGMGVCSLVLTQMIRLPEKAAA